MNALITRRALLRGGLVVGAGLTVGFPVARGARGVALAQTAGVFAPNQWLRIDRDGVVTIVNSVPEMGQGSLTTTSMIIADELDAILDQVRVEQAPANPALYKNPVTGTQSYGGSRGVRDHLAMWRKAAAAAREMLVQAAANEWGVPVESVETEQGAVVHRPSGRRLLYGQLVDRAQQLPVPQNPTLKTPDKFRYIGKPVKRRDTPEKITGRGIYGTDVQVPGMLVASIERCPVFGGKVKSFDATAATQVKGVKHVVQVSNGIAVVADGFWTALQGRRALRVTWDEGPMAQVSSTMIAREYEAAAKQPGQVARNDGDAEKVLAAGGRVHEAVYQVPFLEHACMEPMNATAQVMPDACVVWAPTQNPGGTQATAARLTGLPPEKVTVHTTLLGGGFGRRGEQDFIVDAVETSKAVGAPVKVMWTREDDITHGFYRPATYNLFRATLDASGVPAAWFTRMVGPGILIQKGRAQAGTIDAAAVEAVRNMPYDVPNLRIEWTNKDLGIPLGFWRSVGPSQNGFIIESFIEGAARVRARPRHRRRFLLRQLRCHGGGGVGRPGRGRPRPPARRRHRSRHRSQSRPGQGADGGGRGVRTHGHVLRPDHDRPRSCAAVQLPRLPDAPHQRDAGRRGSHPRFRRGAGRPRRARRAERGARGVQRDLRGDGQAYPHPAHQSRRAEARVSRRRGAVRSPASVLR